MNETQPQAPPAISPYLAGLLGRCPRCGKGALFKGFLALTDRCEVCGLEFDPATSGDGPAVFIVLVAGCVLTGAALLVEIAYQPPLWLHAALWLPLGLALPLLLMRPFKATLVALQYHYRAEEGRRADPDA